MHYQRKKDDDFDENDFDENKLGFWSDLLMICFFIFMCFFLYSMDWNSLREVGLLNIPVSPVPRGSRY